MDVAKLAESLNPGTNLDVTPANETHLPDWMPRLPGARVKGFVTPDGGGLLMGTVRESPSRILRVYRRGFPAAGLEIYSEREDATSGLVVARSSDGCRWALVAAGTEGGATELSYQFRDCARATSEAKRTSDGNGRKGIPGTWMSLETYAEGLAHLDLAAEAAGSLPAELERYLKARKDLRPVFDAAVERQRKMQELARAGQSTAEAFPAWTSTLDDARQAILDVLAVAGLGPTRFTEILAETEWHYLGRPEALPLGLEAEDRQRWLAACHSRFHARDARESSDPSERAAAEKDLERQDAVLERLRDKAMSRRGLAAAVDQALSERRSELEGLPAEDVTLLFQLLDPETSLVWTGDVLYGE